MNVDTLATKARRTGERYISAELRAEGRPRGVEPLVDRRPSAHAEQLPLHPKAMRLGPHRRRLVGDRHVEVHGATRQPITSVVEQGTPGRDGRQARPEVERAA